MSREDIIRMAKEAGLTQKPFCRWGGYLDDLMRFAALVAAAEREACAKVCAWEWKKQGPTADLMADLRKALAAEQPKHPGYVIGSHWLETAYSRVCAGEAEADVLRDIGLVREEAFLTGVAHLKAENEALRRDAERYRWLRDNAAGFSGRTLDAAIDAAMKEDKT